MIGFTDLKPNSYKNLRLNRNKGQNHGNNNKPVRSKPRFTTPLNRPRRTQKGAGSYGCQRTKLLESSRECLQ